MSQHSNATIPAIPNLTFCFPPIPLASGDTITDAHGRKHTVTGVKIVITTAHPSVPVEITLEDKFGGWWAPATSPTA